MTIQQRVYRMAALATIPVHKTGSDKAKGKPESEPVTKPEKEYRKGLLPVSPATVWRWVKIGGFPSPFKIGLNTTVWDAAEVDAWLATRKEAKQ